MTIVTQAGDRIIYMQALDDNSQHEALTKFLMNVPSGSSWTTKLTPNGNEMVFRTQAFNLLDLIKLANGIKPPRKAAIRKMARSVSAPQT